jgi:CBS-domain-containing membrane protein
MVQTTRSLLELTAADLMSRTLITIPRPMSLRAAAHRLAQAGVSGAPVVDEQGRCVGVLSATDLVRWLDRGPHAGGRPAAGNGTCFCSDWQVADLEGLPDDDVGHFMTTDVVSAAPGARLGDLARRMLDAHIHRVIVLADGRPVGVVSSTDVLAAVAAEAQRRRALAEAR